MLTHFEAKTSSRVTKNRERAKVVPNFRNQSKQSSKRYYNANKSTEIGS